MRLQSPRDLSVRLVTHIAHPDLGVCTVLRRCALGRPRLLPLGLGIWKSSMVLVLDVTRAQRI